MANESINLNLIPKGEMPVIHVSQFDNGRQFTINLLKGSDEYTLPQGYTAVLNCRKADRNIVTLATTSVLSNALTFTTTTQLCACAGKNLCEVVIKDAEDYQVGTLNFILEVEKDPLQGGIDSTSEIHDLEDQIEDITTEIIGENYYTRTETDTLLDAKANAADVYTKSQVDTALSAKANAADVYTKTEVDTALSAKANAADVYTKTEVDTALSAKANAADVYTKTEVDTALSAKANTADLATVAITGSYTDLTNKPDLSIYAKESDLILATGTENEAPYQIRQAPSNIGNLALEKLVGVSCVFNQLVNTGDTSINTVSGHKYYTSINGVKSIINGGNAVSINDASEDNIIDLTAMFGSEVAGYIYTLESGTAGAGVSLFKSLFADEYYPYKANTPMSAKPTSKVIKDSNNQTVATIVYSGNELRGLLKVGTDGLYADGDIDDGSGSTQVNKGEYTFTGEENWTQYDTGFLACNFTAKNNSLGICEIYEIVVDMSYGNAPDNSMQLRGNKILIKDTSCANVSALISKITGKKFIYELATPTTAVSTAWSNPIIAKEGGTEEFIDGNEYSIVDLGNLEWAYSDGLFRAQILDIKQPTTYAERKEGFSFDKYYLPDTQISISQSSMTNKCALKYTNYIYIKDTDYSDAATFKTAMNGVYLIYENTNSVGFQMFTGHDTIYSKMPDYRYWG